MKAKLDKIFKNLGFETIDTEGIELDFGQKGDCDLIAVYENLIVVCEITNATNVSSIKNHLRKKKDFFSTLQDKKEEFIFNFLKKNYQRSFEKFDSEYSTSNYHIKFMYVSENSLSDNVHDSYDTISFLDRKLLSYFFDISSIIQKSAIYELYNFFNIKLDDVGPPNDEEDKIIRTSFISPNITTGFKNGVTIVSFPIKAVDLLKCAYVSRQDNWENFGVYQRLIEKKKIKDIREFLVEEKKAFINNIIVSLPDNIGFYEKDDKGNDIKKDPKDISKIKNLELRIPLMINSIGIIDGQHRLYSHFEGEDEFEEDIKKLREKRHLIVTGLIFPKDMEKEERLKFES